MRAEKRQELQKIAEGREAEMFAWEEGTILRLLRDPEAHRRNQQQAAAMEAARSRGVRVPAVRGVTTVLDRPGLVMERIEGPDLLTLLGQQPWKVFWIARVCGELHAQLHTVKAPSAISAPRDMLRERIETSSPLPEHSAQFALAVLAELPDGDSLLHGDFHPGNVLLGGGRPVLIDWTNAARGEPMADVARTRLMLRMGEPPPGTSTLLRAMALVGRSVLVSAYLRSYRRQRPLEMAMVERWEVPIAAARLSEGIEGEVPGLLALLEKARARAG